MQGVGNGDGVLGNPNLIEGKRLMGLLGNDLSLQFSCLGKSRLLRLQDRAVVRFRQAVLEAIHVGAQGAGVVDELGSRACFGFADLEGAFVGAGFLLAKMGSQGDISKTVTHDIDREETVGADVSLQVRE